MYGVPLILNRFGALELVLSFYNQNHSTPLYDVLTKSVRKLNVQKGNYFKMNQKHIVYQEREGDMTIQAEINIQTTRHS